MSTRDFACDAAAGRERADDGAPPRLNPCHEIVQQPIDDLLVENALVAKSLQVQLERFQLHAEFIGDVAVGDSAEIRLPGDRAETGKFGTIDFDGVVAGRRIRKRLELIGAGRVEGSRHWHLVNQSLGSAIVDGMTEIRNGAKAVVLLSGGLDSATTLAVARRDGFTVSALSVDYGQRHRRELDCAAAQARLQELNTSTESSASTCGPSAARRSRTIWQYRKIANRSGRRFRSLTCPLATPSCSPCAWVMPRHIGAFDLFIGANAIDYSGYPDCRPAFLSAFAELANLATAAGVEGKGTFRVHAPLIKLTKAEIIRLGMSLGVDYAETLSCYDPDDAGRPCRRCDSCRLRAKGFAEAGIPDPALIR